MGIPEFDRWVGSIVIYTVMGMIGDVLVHDT